MGALRDLIQEMASKETSLEDGLTKFTEIIKVYSSNRTKYDKYNYARNQLKKHFGNEQVDAVFKVPKTLYEACQREDEEKEKRRSS